ncbi:Hypothetical predicted protein [Mytilus galloprovincialis]|uniref:Mab-21-like HhH/H2TH-like domain-containing protein n=1 Tax=Mytilus galloprovincialis TaxID=29158 RepID=A0A8B6FSG3_MYTGA|nr:Hypothetical predicted protein [Mytilus galloprovincialis]
MCQSIVGSVEHVKTIRLMNTVRDYLKNDTISACITSGSFGEGLEMKGSDIDVMTPIKLIEVYEDPNIPCNPYKICLAMTTDDTQPGFTLLRLLNNERVGKCDLCEDKGPDVFLANNSIKCLSLSECLTIVHGPCLSDEKGFFDFAICLHCKSWITPAIQWITRPNNGWPEDHVKTSIVQHGTLFVPIGVKGSANEDLEWRISFSVSEKFLIYTFTHAQLLCYALMKILLKDVIDVDLECKDLLCSYFIKTILFWISEECSPTIWRPENLISNYMRCFRRLIYYVETSVCPHYFIPEINLFENKINVHSKKILLNKLYILNSRGWQCILFSKRLSNFNELTFQRFLEPTLPHIEHVSALEKLLFSIIWPANGLLQNQSTPLKHIMHKVLSIESSKIKYLFSFYMSNTCWEKLKCISFEDISDNKFRYKQYKTCISSLLGSLRRDAVSGWLLLASFFYNIKCYHSAIYILQYSLFKLTPEKFQRCMKLSQVHNELLNLSIFKKMKIGKLMKFKMVDHVFYEEQSWLLPDELQIEGTMQNYRISPVVYAHFLRLLCNYRLKNTRQCRDYLLNLQTVIEENYFIITSFDKAVSYNLLGKVFQLIGDTVSAERAFIHSIVFELYSELDRL